MATLVAVSLRYAVDMDTDGPGEAYLSESPRISDRSMKQAAGTLLYRETANGLEVLLIHPSGNYNRRAPWGIPKGECDHEESLEAAARRETYEETGLEPLDLVSLGYIDYTKSRKRVHCFAGPAPVGVEPRCASWEVDRCEFLPLDQARKLIHPDQAVFLDRLENALPKKA